MEKRAPHAVSIGLDVKQHPKITILYQELYSGSERIVGTVDITYNTLRFKGGFFADRLVAMACFCFVTPCLMRVGVLDSGGGFALRVMVLDAGGGFALQMVGTNSLIVKQKH